MSRSTLVTSVLAFAAGAAASAAVVVGLLPAAREPAPITAPPPAAPPPRPKPLELAPPPRAVTRTVSGGWRLFRHDEPVLVRGGSGYLGNQAIPIYLLPPRGILGSAMVSGTKLTADQRKVVVRTDEEGDLPRTEFGRLSPGPHVLVVDYNDDGEFTEGLDAYLAVWVLAPR